MNIKLTLSYDGTNYSGFQSQKNENGIEDFLKKTICQILKADKISVICAGRTDAGVHAEGQVVNFHATNNMKETNWVLALNSLLPRDIRINNCEFVPDSFNSRRTAYAREYWYQIVNDKTISALYQRYYTHIYWGDLDTEKLNEYSKYLIGEYDFTSFCSSGDQNKTKIRRVERIDFTRNGNLVICKIIGNAFLQNMVRIMVGTILDLYKENRSPETIKEILELKERKVAGVTYPPKGLVLKKVYYKEV